MKMSTRGRYAARAVIDIAFNQREAPVQLKEVSRRQEISLRYLEQLITPLIAAGILSSSRGPKGGVWLARPPEQVTLGEVIRVVEGNTAPVACGSDAKACRRREMCVMGDVWSEITAAMDNVLGGFTIQGLVDKQREKLAAESAMYYL